MRNRLGLAQYLACFVLLVWSGISSSAGADDASAALRARAATLYSERAYDQAYQAWKQLADRGVPDADRPKLEFFLADSLWRSQPGPEKVEEARAVLQAIADAHPTSNIGAEAWESIGDSWLASDRDWPRAWEAYQKALAFWAASDDLDLARERYLAIVWKATGPPGESNRVTSLPLDVLSNALRIAQSDENIARARFFLGAWLADQDDPFSIRRAGSEWSLVVAMGPGTAVYESALFRLAQWSLVAGASEWRPDGTLEVMPNFQRAYGLFQRLLEEFPGDSRYAKIVTDQMAELTRAELDLATDKNYLPGSEPLVLVESRNLPAVDMALYKVNLLTAFQPKPDTDPDAWINGIRLDGLAAVRQWKHNFAGFRPLQPLRSELPMEALNEPGAYILEASANGLKARTLIVVTTAAAIFKPSAEDVVAFVCDVRSGQACPDVSAGLWQAERDNGSWRWTFVEPAATSELLRFGIPSDQSRGSVSLLMFANAGESPVFVTAYAAQRLATAGGWRVQVITDRRFCRPGEVVEWKIIAREMAGNTLRTPAGEAVEWRVLDPSGEELARGEILLTEFGGGWGRFETDATQALGDYTIEFWTRGELIEEAILFRLNELPDPAFFVALGIPGQSGRTVRLGETLRIRVGATYPAGGGVPDALVRIVVRESPYHSDVLSKRNSLDQTVIAGEVSRIIRQEEMRTAPDGTIVVEVPTPPDSPVDLIYDVDVIVRDASGREVAAERQFVVARQGYFADLDMSERVIQPGAEADVSIWTRDANETPVSTTGTIIIRREVWEEIWTAPDGRDVTGEELDRLRQQLFPPQGQAGWHFKSRNVRRVEVSRREVTTNAAGQGIFKFLSADDGLFRISWESSDGDGPPVTGETAVWVSSAATQMLAYKGRGIQIIANPQALADGKNVDVLLVTDTTQRDVMFAVGAGQDLYRAEIIHIEGDAKLIQLENDPRFAPNVFLQAAMIRSGEFLSDTIEIRFPNWENRLNVQLQEVATIFHPGGKGALNLFVSDADGNPVRAEVALSVVDEFAEPLSDEMLSDPLDIFHGGLRMQGGGIVSSLSDTPTVFETRSLRGVMSTRRVESPYDGASSLAYSRSGLAGYLKKNKDQAGLDSTFIASGREGGALRAPQRTVALWRPGLHTSTAGEGRVMVSFPDALTNWRISAWATSTKASFGFVTQSVKTTLPLVAELTAPRFLIRGDITEIHTAIRNGSTDPVRVKAELAANLLEIDKPIRDQRIKPSETLNLIWSVATSGAGTSAMQFDVSSGDEKDQFKVEFPVLNKGRKASIYTSGMARRDALDIAIDMPVNHEQDSLSLLVAVAPLGESVMDALPTLLALSPMNIEEVISRFVPAVELKDRLLSLGMSNEQFTARVVDSAKVTTASPDWLAGVTAKSLLQVYEQQHEDGSWAWCKGGDSDSWMTSYVLWGMRRAQMSGVGIREDKFDAAITWLRNSAKDEKFSLGHRVWMLHALSLAHSGRDKPTPDESAALDAIWNVKSELSPDSVAVFALATHYFNQPQRAIALAKMVTESAKMESVTDGSQAEAKWSVAANDGSLANSVEATAFAVAALTAIDPKNPLIEAGITCLMKNRNGLQWANSRTSSIVIACLMPHLQAIEASRADAIELSVNGTRIERPQLTEDTVEKNIFHIDRTLLKSDRNVITLRQANGEAPMYYSIQLDYFTDSPVSSAVEVPFSIQRDFFKLAARQTLLDGWKYTTTEWKDGDAMAPNARIEGFLTVESQALSSYIQIRDRLPAGLEPVDIQSGQILLAKNTSGETISAFVEVRDQEVVFQIPQLPVGQWKLSYQFRASMTGVFFGPPASLLTSYGSEPTVATPSWTVRVQP